MNVGVTKQSIMFVWHAAVAIAVRLLLVLLGAGEALVWQPEVTTPANTILKTREGIRLLQLGASPYDGASCHIPPLWLAVVAPVAHHPVLRVVPNIICDVVAAAALYTAAARLFQAGLPTHKGQTRDAPWLDAGQLALLYLFNPFAVLSCIAGTLTSAENAAVMVAVAGGCLGNGPLAGFGLAVGAYLGLHPLLLLVPLLLMLWQSAEDPLQAVPLGPPSAAHLQQSGTSKQAVASAAADDGDASMLALEGSIEASAPHSSVTATGGLQQRRAHQKPEPQQQQQHTQHDHKAMKQHQQQQDHRTAAGALQRHGLLRCLLCLGSLVACSIALLSLSDQVLQHHPGSQCLGPAVAALQGQTVGASSGSSSSTSTVSLQDTLGSCWAGRVYGLTLFLQDLTPNIGLWWYFFTEVFTEFQPFFLFVFHSFALALMLPLAIRFSSRPLFVTWAQLFVCCMFKPYACVGDMVPWLALLPLLQQQLQSMKLKLFLVNSFVLLLVLGPSMWHQWIILDSANANFFYSITLLLGVWYTVFLMQLLRLTCLLDRWLAGKGPPPILVSADGSEVCS